MADDVKIDMSDGGMRACVYRARPADLARLRDLPALRHVCLIGVRPTPAVVRAVVALPGLDAVTLDSGRLPPDLFPLLDALPPGAAVKVAVGERHAAAWAAFRRRQVDRVARLPPDRRRAAAERYARGVAAVGFRPFDPAYRTVVIREADAGDEDVRLLRWLPDLEALRFGRCWKVTTAALRRLAGHPRLRVLDLNGPRFTAPLRVLARLPALEELTFFPEDGPDLGDADLAGVERLAGLRRLHGWSGRFTEATLARVGKLARLERLALPSVELGGDDGLRHLAGLRDLEALSLHTPTPVTAECLRPLAGLARLEFLSLPVGAGDGDGLRHLSGLSALRFLMLTGGGVTDAGLRHLHGLAGLRAVGVGRTRVTRAGAEALAAALPDVAVHLERAVFKSRQAVVRFRRHAVGGFASALIPARWTRRGEDARWTEDGFEEYDEGWEVAGSDAAEIRLWVEDDPDEPDAASYLRACARDSSGRMPKRFETGAARVAAGGDSAAAAFPRDGVSCLAGVAILGGRAGAVQGEAEPRRFAALRGLFTYVAASLRVGPDALAGEEVDVPVGELG